MEDEVSRLAEVLPLSEGVADPLAEMRPTANPLAAVSFGVLSFNDVESAGSEDSGSDAGGDCFAASGVGEAFSGGVGASSSMSSAGFGKVLKVEPRDVYLRDG